MLIRRLVYREGKLHSVDPDEAIPRVLYLVLGMHVVKSAPLPPLKMTDL